jgi:hypothetical protein
MQTTKKAFSIGAAIVLLALVLFLALDAVGPAFSAAPLKLLLAATPTPTPEPPIPLKPISGLTSLNANVKIGVNGLINGQRAQGELDAVVTSNDQKQSKVTVTGGLLGQIAAQLGGSVLGLFTPSSVDLYKTPEGAYIVANSFFPICVKPKTEDVPSQLDDVSPQSMLGMLTGSDVARGQFVGNETLNGKAVKHYVLDGQAFLYAAQNSSDPKLKEFGDALWSATNADLYVDAAGGYPVKFRGGYSGTYEPLKFEGDFSVDIDLTGINTNSAVTLPKACANPITP